MMELTKRIPARTKTIRFRWLHKNWLEMSPRYRECRDRYSEGKGPATPCYWCKHKFEDGEMMALGCVEDVGNRVFCQSCADEADPPRPDIIGIDFGYDSEQGGG